LKVTRSFCGSPTSVGDSTRADAGPLGVGQPVWDDATNAPAAVLWGPSGELGRIPSVAANPTAGPTSGFAALSGGAWVGVFRTDELYLAAYPVSTTSSAPSDKTPTSTPTGDTTGGGPSGPGA